MTYRHRYELKTCLSGVLLASVCLPFGWATAATAQATSHAYEIPAEDAATALQVFARQSGRQLLFPYNAVQGRKTPAVNGTLPDRVVLARLTAATGLTVSSDDGKTITLQAVAVPVTQRVAIAAQPAAAATQDGPTAAVEPSAVAPTPSTTQLGEVVVTASRQTQNLQKVSTAVAVISGADISRQALQNIGQVFQDTPSIQATGQPGGFSVDIRGLGGDLAGGRTQGSAALVTDGVYQINPQNTTVGFFDVSRIEVLEGPQSTRYGPNADGGIVNVISNDPDFHGLSGMANLSGGDYGLFRGEAAVNLPINDQLALRLSGAVINRDSYFSPAEGDAKAQSLRAKLLYQPTNDLKVKITYEVDHIGGTGAGSSAGNLPASPNKVGVYAGDSINNYANPWGQSPSDPVNASSANILENTLIANVTYNVGRIAVLDVTGSYTNITGHETEVIYLPPWSTGQPGYGPTVSGARADEFAPFDQYTAEVRLHNAAGSRIQWNIGYYHWNYLDQNTLEDASFVDVPPVKTITDTNALYAEVTYPITDRLRLIAGGRESFDHREFNFNNGGVVTPLFGISFTHADYRAGVEFDVTPRSLLYFTASSAYRPGGFSAYDPASGEADSFKSEINRSYELGSKNRFFDNRLQLNGTVFYYDITNYQDIDSYTGFVPVEGGAVCASGDVRAGCQTPTFGLTAHTLGVEGQVRALLTRDDILNINATYLHAVFADHQATCATVAAPTGGGCYDGYNSEAPYDSGAPLFYNVSGAVQPHSPKYAFTISYQHIFHLPGNSTLSAGGDAFHSTSYWVHPVEDAEYYGYQPGYWLGNANVTFTPSHGNWTLTGWIRNVSNYAVKESTLPVVTIGDPRTFGGTVGFKW
ncbi:MAG: TonB-dependent receptor [Caulobacteraceae bacterium]